jgi:acetyl-CoA carboxylase carboxyltransferase component
MGDGMKEKIDELERERARLKSPDASRQKAIQRQHSRGKLTAPERMDLLYDQGSFLETGAWGKPRLTGFDIDQKNLQGDGVIAGWGAVEGRTVYAYAQDFTQAAGTVATVHAKRALRVMRQALKARRPMLHLIDSGGVRVQDAVTRDYNEAYPAYFQIQSISSGVIPQIGLLMGPCAAGAAYSPILCDFLIMVEGNSHMYVASPTLIKSAQFVEVSEEEVGGARMHAKVSGCADLLAADDEDCIAKAKRLLSYLPAHNREKTPIVKCGDDPGRRDDALLDLVPTNSKKPYNMLRVIELIVDQKSFLS